MNRILHQLKSTSHWLDQVVICDAYHGVCCWLQALGSASVDLHPFLLPVIRYSVDVSQPQHVYLCEDGLELWLMTVHCAPTMSLHLHDLFPALLPVLGIILSYLLLDPGTSIFWLCVRLNLDIWNMEMN